MTSPHLFRSYGSAWHLFDRAAFDLDRNEIEIPGSTLTIGFYSEERCIADVSVSGLRSVTSWVVMLCASGFDGAASPPS